MLAGKPRIQSFFLICVSFAFLAAPVSWAATITVCGDGSGDYLTIQEGIDAAVAGDEVVICPGTYTGDGNRDLDYSGKAITVRGTDPEDPDVVAATVIDCQGTETEPHRGFKFHSSETADSMLVGLTVTNGYGPEEELVPDYWKSVGGAIVCISSSPTIANCVFSNNSANSGGGMCNRDNSRPTLTNCTFSGNGNPVGYGGGMYNDFSSPILTNCTFIFNFGNFGGGMYNLCSNPELTYCAFIHNFAQEGCGITNWWYSDPLLSNCVFNQNQGLSGARRGGGILNWHNCNPTLTNCTFIDNKAHSGGGMENRVNSNAKLTNCTFVGNSGIWGGGGILLSSSNPTLVNCTFSSNSSTRGGGIYNEEGSPVLTNCIFSGNGVSASAKSYGGGIYNIADGNPILTNCTFNGNRVYSSGGGIYSENSNPILANCVLWADSPEEIFVSSGSPIVTYSNVQGGWPGEGNIDADPLFMDPGYWDDRGTPDHSNDDFWVDGDYHLQPDSPCIDAGDNDSVPEDIDTDLDGNPRIADGNGDGIAIVDMGAYELNLTIIATLDILPGAGRNPFMPNKKSKGRIPMAILGSEELAAEDIDLTSIKIAGVIGPVKTSTDKDVDGDGLVDLVMHFSRRAMIDALSLDTYEVGATVDITVTANRLEDGRPIAATDSIVIAGKGD